MADRQHVDRFFDLRRRINKPVVEETLRTDLLAIGSNKKTNLRSTRSYREAEAERARTALRTQWAKLHARYTRVQALADAAHVICITARP